MLQAVDCFSFSHLRQVNNLNLSKKKVNAFPFLFLPLELPRPTLAGAWCGQRRRRAKTRWWTAAKVQGSLQIQIYHQWSIIFSNNIFAPTPLQHNSIGKTPFKFLGCLTWLAFILQLLGSFHPLLLVSKSCYVFVKAVTCMCQCCYMYRVLFFTVPPKFQY